MHLNAAWGSMLAGGGRGPRVLLLAFAVCALACLIGSPAAFAGGRIALVIGNSKYQKVAALANPDNDARLMAKTLRGLGFKLVGGGAQLDLDKQQFDSVAQEFGNAALGADVALFYYAGHGVQIHGTNYLVPVSADPHKPADVFFQMLDANLVLQEMEGSGARLKVMILDACRNNPFRMRGFRAMGGGGLAQMQAPVGTFISFATQPGEEALDGNSGHSPYTAALAKVVRKPGLNIFSTFNEVGLEVAHATNGQQRPWLSSSPINGDFYFAGSGKPGPAVEQAAAYKAAKSLNSKEGWDAFLNHYKKGFYVDLARAQRDNILAKERAQAAAQAAAEARQRAEAAANGAALEEARRAAAAAKAGQLAAEKKAREVAAKRTAEDKAAKEAIAKAAREAAAAKAAQQAAEKAAREAAARRDAETKAAQDAIVKAQAEKAALAKAAAAAKAEQKRKQEAASKLAALTPTSRDATAPAGPKLDTSDIVQLLKLRLRDVGCEPGDMTTLWDPGTRHALEKFNKYAHTHLDVAKPSMAALDAVQAKHGRVCPLECRRGTKAEGDHCVAIACKHGYTRGSDGNCHKVAKRSPPKADGHHKSGNSSNGKNGYVLRDRCRGGNMSACRTLCNTGHWRACRKLRFGGGFGARHHGRGHNRGQLNSGRAFSR